VTIYDPAISPNHVASLKKEFGGSIISQNYESTPSGYNVLVVVGADYEPISTKAPQSSN